MAPVLGFESHGGRTSSGLQASPGGVRLLWFCLIGEVVPDSGNGYVLMVRSHNGDNEA